MISAFLTAFGAVFLAELPDKTMFASVVLTTRYKRPLAVWTGAAAAFISFEGKRFFPRVGEFSPEVLRALAPGACVMGAGTVGAAATTP